MIANLLGTGDRPTETIDLAVRFDCEDYCDSCGDCLYCFSEDPCHPAGGQHSWVVYPDQVEEFKIRYGLVGEDTNG
jgi:hypothetical protein